MTIEKNHNLAELEPHLLWKYFQEICGIPHPSYHEEKLAAFLKQFGEEHKLETIVDEAGNVVIRKPATPGFENTKTVILQSHLDMVPDKSKASTHDFLKDAIEAYVDDDWVTANDTTLGADNGIGIAATLAILASTDIKHGPLVGLFTMTEETGLIGAYQLGEDAVKGDILINLDTETDGEFYIGCAGGVDTDMVLPYRKESIPDQSTSFKLIVSGLKGGHSGSDIHLGLGNSIKILTRILWAASRKYDLRIAKFDAGSPVHNAIPREGEAWITVPKKSLKEFTGFLEAIKKVIRNELISVDPELKIDLKEVLLPPFVFDLFTQQRLLNTLYGCPHGVIDMSPSVPGLVQTSTNLGHVRTENEVVIVYTLQRGSVDSLKDEVANSIYCIFELAGGKATFSNPYPGWDPRPSSQIVQVSKKSYENLFGKEPDIKAIHAGLECGLIGHKNPELDMISIGPTILGAHSPSEKVHIVSVDRFWKLLLDILKNIPKK